MNKEQTAKRIKVMQAYVDGGKVQIRHVSAEESEWVDEPNPSWSLAFEYRIKPGPREWNIALHKSGQFYQFDPDEYYESDFKIVLVREVLD